MGFGGITHSGKTSGAQPQTAHRWPLRSRAQEAARTSTNLAAQNHLAEPVRHDELGEGALARPESDCALSIHQGQPRQRLQPFLRRDSRQASRRLLVLPAERPVPFHRLSALPPLLVFQP